MDIATWPFRMVGFWLWYLKEFVVANMSGIRGIISRGHDSTPGVVTITPGTLVVGAGETKDGVRIMYVHGMYNKSADELRDDLRDMEERMLKGIMFRPRLNEDAK